MHQDSRNLHRVPWDKDTALERIREHLDREGPLLPILHALQDEFGYVAGGRRAARSPRR